MAFKRIWWKIALVAAGLAFLFWNPVTRRAILWVLPLGSGIDDLIVILCVVVAIIIAFVRGWIAIPSLFRERRNRS